MATKNNEATKTMAQLIQELKALLDYYEVNYDDTNDTILRLELESAIGVINRCRRFTPTEEALYDKKYEDKVLPLTIAGFMKNGAEGEVSHTENGIMRQYGSANKYPEEMLEDITPLAKWG